MKSAFFRNRRLNMNKYLSFLLACDQERKQVESLRFDRIRFYFIYCLLIVA